MNEIINKLFSNYLSEQSVASKPDYSTLAKSALHKNILNAEQTACFEELFELTSQIHFLEVKDAFFSGCKLGAKASKEFIT
ncbi:MAG: hypothetical protein IJW89_02075 [Clostridia bacterium]|nr:hypothetical protein [Clostridia bacterium]